MKAYFGAVLIALLFAAPAFASVTVSQPKSGAVAGSPVQFDGAGSAPACSRGVASMGVYVNNVLKSVSPGSGIDTAIPLAAGNYQAVVQEWDYCGGSSTSTPIAITVSNPTGVSVSSPANNSTVGSPVQIVAAASAGGCSKGVASMGVYVDNALKYVGNGSSLNTSIPLNPGTHRAVVQEWDYCGAASTGAINVNVTSDDGVFITSPSNNGTVSSPVQFTATSAASSCPQGVASMGVYIDNSLKYTSQGSSLNASVAIGPGNHNAVVQEWDDCGRSAKNAVSIDVSGQQGKVLSNLQASAGWDQWGELPPTMDVCSPCSGVSWSMTQHIQSPSLSGNATRFHLSGTTPYSAALWSNKIMGQGSTQGLPDTDRTLIPALHNFVYDADVYVTNAKITQALEFDVNMYLDGEGMEWGTECNNLDGNHWDVWDNVNTKWSSIGQPCNLKNGWNHVTVVVERESNNNLLYKSITWNGTTYTINRTYPPFNVPSGWYGMTVNYQMDGNHNTAANTTYVDNLNLRYW